MTEEFIAYEGKLYLPERDTKYLDEVGDRVMELDEQYTKDGLYFDDVVWAVQAHVLSGTFYNLNDLYHVQNILEVVCNEFVAH